MEWNGARKVAWRRGARGEGAKAEAEAEVVRARRATDLSWNCPGPRKGIAGWADGRGRRFGVVSAENWEERDVDRIGSDKIGSDKIGSDKIGSDRNSRREDDPGAGKANGRGAAGGGGGGRETNSSACNSSACACGWTHHGGGRQMRGQTDAQGGWEHGSR